MSDRGFLCGKRKAKLEKRCSFSLLLLLFASLSACLLVLLPPLAHLLGKVRDGVREEELEEGIKRVLAAHCSTGQLSCALVRFMEDFSSSVLLLYLSVVVASLPRQPYFY